MRGDCVLLRDFKKHIFGRTGGGLVCIMGKVFDQR